MENSDLLSFADTILTGWTGEYFNGDAIEKFVCNHPDKSMIIDIFPSTVTDPDKYYQVSVFYRKWVDNDTDKDTYRRYETQYLELIKSLWLYNTVDICYDLRFNHYFRKGMTKLSSFLKLCSSADIQRDVKEWMVLEKLATLALREAGFLAVYFRELEVIAYINDFYLLIMVKDSATFQDLRFVANIVDVYVVVQHDQNLYVSNRVWDEDGCLAKDSFKSLNMRNGRLFRPFFCNC